MNDSLGSFLDLLQRSEDLRDAAKKALVEGDNLRAHRMLKKSDRKQTGLALSRPVSSH